MCLAAPSLVVEVGLDTAVVECFGQRREVSLVLLDEPVALGDYLLVQAGGFAFERMDCAAGETALATMRELLRDEGADAPQAAGGEA